MPRAALDLGTRRSFVSGSYVASSAADRFVTRHPGDDSVICEVEPAGPDDVDAAVAAARGAFADWAATPAVARGRILGRAVQILRERNDELARLETLDTGKPITETSTVDIATGADVLEFYAGVAPALAGETVDFADVGFARLRREPLGVCAGIGAWNYPMQIAMWKSGLALACGNTMVFKPSELTPITATVLAEIYCEAGLPPGVFNVVHGDRLVGARLAAHRDVAKVSLTGSVATGKAILHLVADRLAPATLELGGKSPLVVFGDADFDRAVDAAVTHNFTASGQVCSNATRVYVQRGLYADFVDAVASKTRELRIGDPFDSDTVIGPLISPDHRARVLAAVDAARADGARLVVGGAVPSAPALAAGNYLEPTVFADAREGSALVQEEIFGPVMAILCFEHESDVVRQANATEYGLAAGVFTADFARANRVAHALEAGTVWINDYNVLPPAIPFGGYKQSGLGRENGLAAVDHYTQVKSIYSSLEPLP